MTEDQKSSWSDCGSTTTDRRNGRVVNLWMFAWLLPWLALSVAIEKEWITHGWWAAVAAIATGLVGLGTVMAYRRFLREADELRRKVELDALAIAMGIGLVVGITSWPLARAGLTDLAEVPNLIVVMMVTYSIAVLVGMRRYS
ncbi:MAG: hypothetical protein AAF604_15375 [Acidobacteriota bacterium]